MASGAVIAALVGGAGAVALVAYKRAREAAAQPAAGDSDPCAPLKQVNAEAYQACRAARGLLGVLGGIADALGGPNAVDELNRVNDELNGPRKTPMPAIPLSVQGAVYAGGASSYVSIASRTWEYENGCRPFAGVAGWEKCAQGTRSGLFPAARRHPITGPRTDEAFWESEVDGTPDVTTKAAAMFNGTIYDPTTGLDWSSVPGTQPPVSLAKPTTWYAKGEKVTCPAGQVLSPWSELRDARGRPACVTPDGKTGAGAFTASTGGAAPKGSSGYSGGGPWAHLGLGDDDDDDGRGPSGGVTVGGGTPR